MQEQRVGLYLLDPELVPGLALFTPLDLSSAALPLWRAMLAPVNTAGTVPGPSNAPPVSILLVRPWSAPATLPVMLHIHGGGFIAGSPAAYEPQMCALALAAECMIVSVDYPLAPETPYPGALEDCYAVLHAINLRAEQLGIDRGRVGVYGDHAGGWLAAAPGRPLPAM